MNATTSLKKKSSLFLPRSSLIPTITGNAGTGRKRETETHTISDLEQQLSLAVAREDYERAAKLRDQIKQLRTPIN